MADSHKKIEAKEAIKKERRAKNAEYSDKYSPETLRANMSTGGGTPIEKGHKWTNEHRVLQPRDPDTGHFTYNADAEMSLKYKSHGKANADPVAMRNMNLHSDIKKGDVVNLGKQTFIALDSIPYERMKDFFRHYDEGREEYYSYGSLPSKATMEDAFTQIAGNVKAVALSDLVVKKKGRMSASEKQGVAQDKDVVGHVDIEKLGEKTKQEIASKMASAKAKFSPNTKVTQFLAPIGADKAAANAAFNKAVDDALATFGMGQEAKMGIGAQPKPEQPKPEQPKPEQPAPQSKSAQPTEPKQKPSVEDEGYTDAEARRGIMPKSMVGSNGSIDINKVNYDNPKQKLYFDAFSLEIQKHPEKFNMTPEKAKQINGKVLAYLAKKGAFKGGK